MEKSYRLNFFFIRLHEETELSSDPADYAQKKLPVSVINFLLSSRAKMLKSLETVHPKSKWKNQTLPDGTKRLRTWLAYSDKKKAIFCLHCLIFGLPKITRNASVFAREGYADWHNVSRDIEIHETSAYHQESDISVIRWYAGKSKVDKQMAEVENYLVHHNRAVVSVVIDCIRYLSQEMMAFRKSDNKEGKFMNLFKLLAKHNTDARVYLENLKKHRAEGTRLRVNFLAYDSLMNLASIMKALVVERICGRINEATYFSIIADSTQDSSKAETTVLLTRYIEGSDGTSASHLHFPIVVERLIAVFTSKGTAGKELYEKITNILKTNNLDISKIIGQSYDGAKNMSGSEQGLHTLIRRDCSMALYVWCHAHRFSLVVEKTVEFCGVMRQFFGLLEELHKFMNGHRRHGTFVEILEKSMKNKRKRVKRVCTTRWNSKHAACTTLLSCYSEIMESLEKISQDKNSTKESVTQAIGLKTRFATFDFIATLKICVTIFEVLAPATTWLQGIMIDFGSATEIIHDTDNELKKLRTEQSWAKLEKEILEMATNLGIEMKKKKNFIPKEIF